MLDNLNYSRLIKQCILYIESDYMYIASITEISDLLGISKHHLIREFSKQVGISPNKYLIKYKLDRAKLLLAYENLSIDAVSEAVGFSCGNYFSKVFKKEYGLTPSEFIQSTPVLNPNRTNDSIFL